MRKYFMKIFRKFVKFLDICLIWLPKYREEFGKQILRNLLLFR